MQMNAKIAPAAARANPFLTTLDMIWPLVYALGVILACAFLLAPFIVVFIVSISASQTVVFPPPAYSLIHYFNIPSDLVDAFFRSLKLGLLVISIDIALCLPAAFALVRGHLPGSAVIENMLRAPLQVPGIVMAVALYLAYSLLLRVASVPLRGTFAGLVVAHVVLTYPYMLSTVVVRLSIMANRLEHVAYGLGAGFLRTMWRVTLPQLRPALIAGSFLAFVTSFEDVPVALFVAPASTTVTLPVAMFQYVSESFSPALFAAAILVILFTVVFVIALEFLVGLSRVLSGKA